MPNHETPLSIIEAVGVPILGPSANFHGEQTPYEMSDVNPQLVGLVDLLVPGSCNLKQASTVVDATGEKLNIIRQGAVVLSNL
jgi:L-threonylcarbamoyladenylate synthase